ncbi:MAG: 2-amino-4-ketopentanoate thiolase [Bacilli bacterium]|nr:2-amino-4-ketopentanoate thiolase [Bacilli bacterium]
MNEIGTYVRIRRTLLNPEERSDNLPEDTKKVPFKMWVKGYLQEEVELFDIVTIKTLTGRIETGRLKEVNPPYKHSYGDFVPEVMVLSDVIRNDFFGDHNE